MTDPLPDPVPLPETPVPDMVVRAVRELDLLVLPSGDTSFLLDIVELFQSHFGTRSDETIFSYSDILHDLFLKKPLSELTDNPEEWEEVSPTLWRNIRDVNAYSNMATHEIYWLVTERRPNNTYPPHVSQHYETPEE